MNETALNDNPNFVREDYTHSANSLFHFVGAAEYLIEALRRRALCPRYCIEDVRYLNIIINNERINEVAVLQKCFCDIPLQNVFKKFSVKLTENNPGITEEERKKIPTVLSHADLYGEFAIAFSKEWGERNNLQPVHYMIEGTSNVDEFSNSLNDALEEENIPDSIADSMINRICYTKPIRGRMKRWSRDGEKFEYEIFKNFHDEHEWRYVPPKIASVPVDRLIPDKNLLSVHNLLKEMSDRVEDRSFQDIWLNFQYNDIRYLIVPDNGGRIELIKAINDLDANLFDTDTGELQKHILISKIIVIDEFEKDI